MATTDAPSPPRSHPEQIAAPLGPDSLTWRYFGDRRQLFGAVRAGILQAMHPAISDGLVEHSDVFGDPLDRLLRSAIPILGVIYDDQPGGTGTMIRDLHKNIRSGPDSPRRYRSLDPDVFYWAHATFFESMISTQRLYAAALTEEQEHQLYAESITWWQRYGMSMRPVPRDYDAFRAYWDDTVANTLEGTVAAREIIWNTALPTPPWPAVAMGWKLTGPAVTTASRWLLRGTLPPAAREHLGFRWSRADELALRGLRTTLHTAWPVVPHAIARTPAARQADARALATAA